MPMKTLPLLFLTCLCTAVAYAAGDASNDGELLYNGIRLRRVSGRRAMK